ncbi:MAG: DUF4097 domain-containing protein [Bacillota bacterium]|nr:DUF4097 domain-containing protein [Bacillota bacterium]
MKEERIRILKMVEEGKITVDEALNLLEQLEQNQGSSTTHFEEAKKEDTVHQKLQSTKDKIFEFVDTAIKKIKEVDFDFNFGQSVEISHIFHQGNVVPREIDIDIANGSVHIIPWDQQDVRVECKAKVYRAENEDQARQNFLKDASFSIEGAKLRFTTQQKWMKVDTLLYVPQAEYERVRVRLFNGPISGDNMKVEDLKVKTANGKINFTTVSGKKVEVETANGQIKMMNSFVDHIEAETINGTIKLDGDFRKAELESFNGNLLTNLFGNRCESFSAKATTGAIDLYVPKDLGVHGKIKTNLGGINVLLDGIEILDEKNEMVQKNLRFQSVNHSESLLKIFAETKTGSVTIHQGDGVTPFK